MDVVNKVNCFTFFCPSKPQYVCSILNLDKHIEFLPVLLTYISILTEDIVKKFLYYVKKSGRYLKVVLELALRSICLYRSFLTERGDRADFQSIEV